MFVPIYGNKNANIIPFYIIMAIVSLCFSIILAYAYKHNPKLANFMNKLFAWIALIFMIVAPFIIIAVVVFILIAIFKN